MSLRLAGEALVPGGGRHKFLNSGGCGTEFTSAELRVDLMVESQVLSDIVSLSSTTQVG